MKTWIYKMALITGISFFSIVSLNSCTVKDDLDTALAQRYLVTSVLNRNLFISQATHNDADITAEFNGISFLFSGSGGSTGTASAANDLFTVNGSWNVNANYDKIGFSFPTNTMGSLAFMNRQWLINTSDPNIVMLTDANGGKDILYFAGLK